MTRFSEALATRAFAWLEGTAIFSNIGAWVVALMSGFVMERLTSAPLLVTLASAIVPFAGLVTAAVSGAAADARDRRLVILVAKVLLLTSVTFLGAIAIAGELTPGRLLLGLAGVGLASGTSSPSWWSLVGALVPARLVPAAFGVDSFQSNIGQVVAPVLGGTILHSTNAGVLFFVCAALFVPLIGFLVIWRGRSDLRLSTPVSGAGERTIGAISAGWRFFLYTPGLRSITVRVILYATPAAALGALLPLLAARELHATAFTYGLYLATGGIGALLASLVLPRLHARIHLDAVVAGATLANAAAVALVSIFAHPFVAVLVLLIAGAAVALVTTSLTIATRGLAPEWVSTRLLAIYYLFQQAPFAAGGIVFGIIATFLPLRTTLLVDAGLFLPGILVIPRYGLAVANRNVHAPASLPSLAVGEHVDPDDGPVLVLIEYQLAEADVDDFLQAMSELRLVRRRLGASRWGVYEDVTLHGRFVETFLVPSWERYLLQRQHYTQADAAAETAAERYHEGSEPPRVTRFVHPETTEAARARSSWRREMARLITEPFVEPSSPSGDRRQSGHSSPDRHLT